MVFVGSPRWTELQNVQLTSSTVQSSLLSGCSVYTAPTDSSNDVTSLTSSWVPLTADSSTLPVMTGHIPCTVDLSNGVTSFQDVSQLISTLENSCNIDQDPALVVPWTEMATASTSMHDYQSGDTPATQVSSTYEMLLIPGDIHHTTTNQYPLTFSLSPLSPMSDDADTSSDVQFFLAHGGLVCSTAMSDFPPSPPDSTVSSPGVELPAMAASGQPLLAPPPYSTQLMTSRAPPRNTRPRETPAPPPPYPVRSRTETRTRVMEPVLTPVTGRIRETHPGTSTIRYRRRDQNPDIERRRTHYCDYPGWST